MIKAGNAAVGRFGSRSLSSAGSIASVVTNNAIVTNKLIIPTSQQSGSANFACQKQHMATTQGAISNLVFTDIHWTMSTASWTIQTLATTYQFKKFVEYPQGTFTPVLYSGVATAQLDSVTRTITSDVLALSIPAGATWWEHTINVSGVLIAHTEYPATATALGLTDGKYASGGAPSHQSSGQASTFMFGSVLITGTVTGASAAKSVTLFGDSILWGAGDITGTGTQGSSGPWGRNLDSAGIGHFRFGVSSMKAQDMAVIISSASATYAPLQTLLQACTTHAIIEFGANDLSLGSRTQVQLLADYATIQGSLTGKQWGLATITPRTSSTDVYATEVNQTVKTDGTWSLLTSVNAAIRAKPSGFTFVPEYADDVMTSRDSGIWKSSPTIGFQPTTDGTHPTTQMAAYLSTNLTIPLP
jgi:lysophospholipase L1-like esterase